MSATQTIDISKLSEAQQNLFKSLFEQFCERSEPKEEKKSEPKIWKPEYGDWYWYISSDGQVDNCEWVNGPIDYGRYSMGNCFRTKEEARIAREKQKIKTELQRYADEHNDPEKLEWDKEEIHYDIVFEYKDGHKKGLGAQPAFTFRGMDCVYFTSKEIADVAIQTIGKERILEYMFDIESEEEE